MSLGVKNLDLNSQTLRSQSTLRPIKQPPLTFWDQFLFSTIEPLLDSKEDWIFVMKSKTSTGALIIGTCIIGGFSLLLVMYESVLLSHLTATTYENPIETIQEMVDSDLTVYHIIDKILFEKMQTSQRPGFKEMYHKMIRNGWGIEYKNYSIMEQAFYNGQGGHTMDAQHYNWEASRQIKRLNKKLFLKIKGPYISSPRSVTLRKNGPMTATFDKFIRRAFDHGLFHKIKYQDQLIGRKVQFEKINDTICIKHL